MNAQNPTSASRGIIRVRQGYEAYLCSDEDASEIKCVLVLTSVNFVCLWSMDSEVATAPHGDPVDRIIVIVPHDSDGVDEEH